MYDQSILILQRYECLQSPLLKTVQAVLQLVPVMSLAVAETYPRPTESHFRSSARNACRRRVVQSSTSGARRTVAARTRRTNNYARAGTRVYI